MPVKKDPKLNLPSISLGESATRFLTTISSINTSSTRPEIIKFIRWFGEERSLDSLTGQEVLNYSEQAYASTSKSSEHLSFIKDFLRFAYKEKYTHTNLSIHVRIKKISGKISRGDADRASESVPLTREGYKEAHNRLERLQKERPRIAEEIRKAAADKDFRENAPLHAAREQMSLLDGQIKELEDTLRRAVVIKTTQENGQRITIGDSVIIEHIDSGEHISYSLVSSREADVKYGKISVASPMGQALLNKEIGQTISVNAPSGTINYRIVGIKRI